jgi:hypothetical protein
VKILETVRVITKYVMKTMKSGQSRHRQQQSALFNRSMLSVLSALCGGAASLDKDDQAALTRIVLDARRPDGVVVVTSSVSLVGLAEEAQQQQPATDPTRPQTDLTALVLEQLTTPIERDLRGRGGATNADSTSSDSSELPTASEARMSKAKFTANSLKVKNILFWKAIQ